MTDQQEINVENVYQAMVRNPRKVLDICCEYNHYLLEANAQYKRLMDKVGPGDELDDLDLKITALCDARNEWYWYMEQVYARVQKKMAELETSTAQFRNKFCTTFIMSHNEFDKRIREYQTDDDFDAMLLMYRTGQVNDQSHPGASDMCKSYLKFREEKITLDKLKAACAIYSKLKEDIDERGNPTFACLKAYKNVSVIDASIFARMVDLSRDELDRLRSMNERDTQTINKLCAKLKGEVNAKKQKQYDKVMNLAADVHYRAKYALGLSILADIMGDALSRQEVIDGGMQGGASVKFKFRVMDIFLGLPKTKLSHKKTYITEEEIAKVKELLTSLEFSPKLQNAADDLLADMESMLE